MLSAKLTDSKTLATIILFVMCIQIVPIEGYGTSIIKVILMAICPLIYLSKRPVINKAFIWGLFLLTTCYFCATFAGPVRYSTIGYFALFIICFITYYTLIYSEKIELYWFIRVLKYLIILYAGVLILQQICILIGINSMPLINLRGEPWQSISKLPSLAIEPSHAARLMAVLMLAYMRCVEIAEGHGKLTLSEIFSKEHRIVTILFLWTMLTMGSGTAFIALGILMLYFITFRTAFYMVPMFIGIIAIGGVFDFEQYNRVSKVVYSVSSQDVDEIRNTDGSAAVRIIPLFNFFTNTDLSDQTTWTGEGTLTQDASRSQMHSNKATLPMLKQYGLISMIVALFFVYTCAIKKILSIETLFFILLFGMSLMNIAYLWGALMIFATTRYFQENASNKEFGHQEIIDFNDNP